jgi:hypothetical protein
LVPVQAAQGADQTAKAFNRFELNVHTGELSQRVTRAGIELVIDAVGGAVRILHRLTSVGVAMAGANEFDPHKD